MGVNRRIALLAVAILAATGLAFVVNAESASLKRTATIEAGYFNGSQPMLSHLQGNMTGWNPNGAEWARLLPMNRGSPTPRIGRQSWSANVTIDPEQAKAVVAAAIPSFKVGTISSFRTGWMVPIEDEKGVVTSINVSNISAATSDQARGVVEESLKKGWKAGEPRLMGTIYSVPLLDSSNATIGYMRIDGSSGQIIRTPSTILVISTDQAKNIVNNAVNQLKVGDAKSSGSVWSVDIKYGEKVAAIVLLGKLNTPTSQDAIKAVQDSLNKGWRAGDPKQLRLIYNVPIIDANGNTIADLSVDGTTGNITTGFPLPCR